MLLHPKDRRFPYIAHYYDDIKGNPILYLDSYLSHNLHHITSKRHVSLQTIWYWSYQLCHFLKFAKENNILHLDFKPENVCITKDFKMKVIDFAESILKDSKGTILSKNQDLSRGHTLPYTAPEALQDARQGTSGSDMFSMAHVIYTMLSHKKLFGYKRNSNNKLSQKYKNGSYKTLPFRNFLVSIGPKFMMKYIYFLIMFMLPFKPELRIQPEDTIMIFDYLQNLTEALY